MVDSTVVCFLFVLLGYVCLFVCFFLAIFTNWVPLLRIFNIKKKNKTKQKTKKQLILMGPTSKDFLTKLTQCLRISCEKLSHFRSTSPYTLTCAYSPISFIISFIFVNTQEDLSIQASNALYLYLLISKLNLIPYSPAVLL